MSDDPHRCCAKVYQPHLWRSVQCKRPNGHGPNKAFCKQHNPEAQKARDAERQRKWDAEWAEKKKKWALHAIAPLAIDALQKIADGDNDPRSLAKKILEQYEKSK